MMPTEHNTIKVIAQAANKVAKAAHLAVRETEDHINSQRTVHAAPSVSGP